MPSQPVFTIDATITTDQNGSGEVDIPSFTVTQRCLLSAVRMSNRTTIPFSPDAPAPVVIISYFSMVRGTQTPPPMPPVFKTAILAVPNGTSPISGFDTVDWLLPNASYHFHADLYSFPAGATIIVRFEFYQYDSDLFEQTDAVIRDYENTNTQTAFAFGLSEAYITSLLRTSLDEAKLFQTTNLPSVSCKLSIVDDNNFGSDNIPIGFPRSPYAQFDQQSENIGIFCTLAITVQDDPNLESTALIRAYIAFKITCIPVMATSAHSSLQIQVQEVNFLVDPPKVYFNYIASQANVQARFPTIEAVLSSYFDDLRAGTGMFSHTINTYVGTLSLPDDWNRSKYFQVTFQTIKYIKPTVHEIPVGYMLLIFSVQSRKVPIPCFCEKHLNWVASPDLNSSSGGHNREELTPLHSPLAASRGLEDVPRPQPLIKMVGPMQRTLVNRMANPFTSAGLYPESYLLNASAELVAVGIGNLCYQEIIKPYGNMGDEWQVSDGGDLYMSMGYWWTASIAEAWITSTGFYCSVEASGEGEARAGIRDKCGDDIAVASVNIGISVDPSSVTLSASGRDEFGRSDCYSILGQPSVDIGRPHVTFATNPPAYPVDQIVRWVADQVLGSFKNMLEPEINAKVTLWFLELRREGMFTNPPWPVQFVAAKYFDHSSAVLLLGPYVYE